MKYLSHYTEVKHSELLAATGAFFAFSPKQFHKAKRVGPVKYASLGAGLVCPSVNAAELVKGLGTINAEGIAIDIAENGLKAIIHRELANYETQITGDITNTVEALEDYPITREDIQREYTPFYQHCIDNDYF